MRKMLLSIALAVVAPFAWGQVSETTTTTTTTTEGSGTITEYTPGSTIVLRETSGPRSYRFGKTVTYVTRSGKVLDEETVRTKIKVGVPVRVHYVETGADVMVDRVVIDENYDLVSFVSSAPPVLPDGGTVKARFGFGPMISIRSAALLATVVFVLPIGTSCVSPRK